MRDYEGDLDFDFDFDFGIGTGFDFDFEFDFDFDFDFDFEFDFDFDFGIGIGFDFDFDGCYTGFDEGKVGIDLQLDCVGIFDGYMFDEGMGFVGLDCHFESDFEEFLPFQLL